MCTNGINTTQFEQLIDQIDDYVALQVRHTHKLAHAADTAGYENCHLKLHAASDMLAEVRNLLDEATLRHNQEAIKKQLARFLDFDSDSPNHAEMVNNYDWTKDVTFLDFAREIGKHITVNYMMAK